MVMDNAEELIYYFCFKIDGKITGKESYVKYDAGFNRLLKEKEFNDIVQIVRNNLAQSLRAPRDLIIPINKKEYDLNKPV